MRQREGPGYRCGKAQRERCICVSHIGMQTGHRWQGTGEGGLRLWARPTFILCVSPISDILRVAEYARLCLARAKMSPWLILVLMVLMTTADEPVASLREVVESQQATGLYQVPRLAQSRLLSVGALA